MKKRILQRPEVPQEFDYPDSISDVLKRIYQRRKLTSLDELDASLNKLLPFSLLKGINEATDLLENALRQQQAVVIVGDFDADGATSTAIAVRALHSFGLHNVSFKVPNRFKYGYGLTPGIVEEIIADRPVDLIVTVDNGIASFDGVKVAKDHGVSVLVTDHHLAADQLPVADAIVNPNQPGDEFPSKNLAGVGVIFYVMLALRSRLRETGWFDQQGINEPNMGSLLDIIALGTVADVVPLDHNNRVLVEQGLRRIRSGYACPGIQALITVAKRQPAKLVASDLGFALGPRLNAAGRLEDMSIGISCLLAEDREQATQLAMRLDSLNQERKAIEQEMKSQAIATLEALHLDETQSLPLGLCLYEEEWHQGVIGILASRIKDHLHRPVIAFAEEDEHNLKGSARSIPGVHIRDVLDAIATRHPKMLNKFGGHAMAAGLSLPKSELEAFQQVFHEELSKLISEDDLQSVVLTDGQLMASELTLEVAESLRHAMPWGQEFPEPLFDGEFEVLQSRIVGEQHLKLTVRHPDAHTAVDAIGFNLIGEDGRLPVGPGDIVHLAYKLDVNEFRGERKLQLMLECFDENP